MRRERPGGVNTSEITDPADYRRHRAGFTRRTFVRGAALAGSVAATGMLYRELLAPPARRRGAPLATGVTAERIPPPGEALTPYDDVTGYNNYYEFSTDKHAVADAARGFATRPWTVEVGGRVHRPRTWDVDELLRLAPLEERIYRMRCVEGWSMVIPWLGFPLTELLRRAEPLGDARFVTFETLHDPARMPEQRRSVLPWPYREGLRLDEAMHPLTIMALGLYGEALLPQNGAPLRLVVPWKYGFKGIKSIVRIDLVERQPRTTWPAFAPDEYGFFANVNPEVSHPRWTQAHERRIGEWGRRPTLPFNGYASEVAQLYTGMDLRKHF